MRTPGGLDVHLWHRAAARDSAPAVLFLHGNGENLETMRQGGLFEELDALGVHVVAMDYPGYGKSGGRPSEAAIRDATAASFAWMVERHPASPHVVAGWSLGAAAAIPLAAEQGDAIDGLIAMSPWSTLDAVARSHFPGWLVWLLLGEEYDSLAAAAEVRCPALVIHGEADRLIPFAQGREVSAAFTSPLRWVPVPGAGHNDLLSRSLVWEEMASFLVGLEK